MDLFGSSFCKENQVYIQSLIQELIEPLKAARHGGFKWLTASDLISEVVGSTRPKPVKDGHVSLNVRHDPTW